MTRKTFGIKSELWRYPGAAAWHFVTLPKKQSEEIKKDFSTLRKSWGSLPVTVTLGKTRWQTSLFPDKKSGCYLLPVKADIRKKEGIGHGDRVSFSIIVSPKGK